MDNVKPSQLIEEGLDNLEEYDLGDPEIVNVYIKFKSGVDKTIQFVTPAETPIYAEPITSFGVYELVATAYSFGESPLLYLPDGEGYTFIDLNAVDYVTIKVSPHEQV